MKCLSKCLVLICGRGVGGCREDEENHAIILTLSGDFRGTYTFLSLIRFCTCMGTCPSVCSEAFFLRYWNLVMLFADPLTKFLGDLIEKFLCFENRRREKSSGSRAESNLRGEKGGPNGRGS